MIYESSRDYVGNIVTLIFDGDAPSRTEIFEYITKNYTLFNEPKIEITNPSEHKGLKNPGVITAYL